MLIIMPDCHDFTRQRVVGGDMHALLTHLGLGVLEAHVIAW